VATWPARWAWLPFTCVLITLAVARWPHGGSVPAGARTGNEMAVDADPSDPDIDASAVRFVGDPFDVSTNITAAGTPYMGYRMSIEFDDSILSFVPVGSFYIVYTELGLMRLNAPALVQDCDGDTDPDVFGSSARISGTTTATGQANIVRFECVGPGTSDLHLITLDDCPTYGSTTAAPGPVWLPTALVDAAIICQEAPPTQTPLPGVGGIAELPPLVAATAEEASTPPEGSGWSAGDVAALGGGLTAAVFVAILGAWYARRQRLR